MTAGLLKYFPELSESQLEKFSALDELYRYWNERINVISRKDIDQLYVHHILHSLSIAKFISFKSGTKVIDVGTGGGFPGIPLAIFFPEVNFLLVDSIGKKITVVQEIASALKLENVKAVKSRAEEIDERFDFVLSRAVASVDEICKWTRHLISHQNKNVLKNGWIFLKGGDLSDELKGVEESVIEMDIGNYFSEDFFLTKKIVYISNE